MPPPHNPDVDVYVATDLLKYVYAKLTRELAHLQYDMADYVAAGKLDREANDDLQGWCVSAWEFLYHNTTAAIRNWDTDDRNWDAADNTYWNGLQVMTQVRIEPPETREHHHPNNQYIHGDGATNEYQRGVVYYIAQPPNHPNVARDRRWNRRRR
jgi:hypothetical protein